MIKDPILEKANQILIEKRLEQRKQFHKSKRNKRIIEAGLCPECGEKLQTIFKKKEYIGNPELPYSFKNLISITTCNKNYTHYHKLEHDYDDEYYN